MINPPQRRGNSLKYLLPRQHEIIPLQWLRKHWTFALGMVSCSLGETAGIHSVWMMVARCIKYNSIPIPRHFLWFPGWLSGDIFEDAGNDVGKPSDLFQILYLLRPTYIYSKSNCVVAIFTYNLTLSDQCHRHPCDKYTPNSDGKYDIDTSWP